VLGVDIVGLLMAAAFALLARAAWRRARRGDANSVWVRRSTVADAS
jgi:hypothetical protein